MKRLSGVVGGVGDERQKNRTVPFSPRYKNTTKTMKVSGNEYRTTDFVLMNQNELLNPDRNQDVAKLIGNILLAQYKSRMKSYISKYKEAEIFIELGGLHFNMDDLRFLIDKSQSFLDMRLYGYWDRTSNHYSEEDLFVIIQCKSKEFDELFSKFWFSIAMEISFDLYLVPEHNVSKFKRSSIFKISEHRTSRLLQLSYLKASNQLNGLHFKIVERIH